MPFCIEFASISYEFGTNSFQFLVASTLQKCQLLPFLMLGTIWPWWVQLGRDCGYTMRNQTRPQVLAPQLPQMQPKI